MTDRRRADSSATDAADKSTAWWTNSVGYQIYPASFLDSNGDGIGDLDGIRQRLPYLRDLGVDLIWISPFYPSPMRDGGYDVSDYRGVDPRFGTLTQFDALIADAHALGLRVMADMVLNHTSSDHPWFQQARTSRDSPYRDFYIWRDPAPDGGPPNNWKSHFGGDAWTLDPSTGQYWLHLFLPEQPDLNWDNPRMAAEVDDIFRFWVARGVDGFRIDTAQLFAKHPELPDNPPATAAARPGTGNVESWGSLEHAYEVDQQHNVEVFQRWRSVLEHDEVLLVGEVYILEAEKVARYVENDDGLHLSFWFSLVEAGWDPDGLEEVVREAVATEVDWAWTLSSHDNVRAVTRYGGGDEGRRRALAMHTLLAALPGVLFLYQGEELGLENAVVRPEDARDPVAVSGGAPDRSRDGARTPLPWEPKPGLGFSTSSTPWMPYGERAASDTVAVQAEQPGSPLSRYRALLAARRELASRLSGAVEWLDAGPSVIAFRRGDVAAVANMADAAAAVELAGSGWSCRFTSTGDGPASVDGGRVELAPYEAVLLVAR